MGTNSAKGLPLRMIRNDLLDIPDARIPDGFRLEFYRPGDEAHWLEIHREADLANRFDERTFRRQFGNDARLLASRQIYLVTKDDRRIGTSTAWFKASLGRVHWVAIIPEYQGRGLSKPLLAGTCRRLRDLGHSSAYLTTSTARIAALRLYSAFGFIPDPENVENAEAWATVAELVAAPR